VPRPPKFSPSFSFTHWNVFLSSSKSRKYHVLLVLHNILPQQYLLKNTDHEVRKQATDVRIRGEKTACRPVQLCLQRLKRTRKVYRFGWEVTCLLIWWLQQINQPHFQLNFIS
jgi:hypothetical protein